MSDGLGGDGYSVLGWLRGMACIGAVRGPRQLGVLGEGRGFGSG